MDNILETKTDLNTTDLLSQEIERTLENGRELAIANNEEYEACAEHLKKVKKCMKMWDDERKDMKNPVMTAAKKIEDFFRRFREPLQAEEKKCKSMMIAYNSEQERKRKEAQDKLDRESKKKQLEKEEQERKWREKEEAKRAEAERLEAEGKAEEAAKAQAEADKAAGKAEERAEEAETIEAPVIAKEEKPSGISYRMKYTGVVVDFAKLPDSYKIANQSMLDKTIQAQKGQIPVPGVEIKTEKIAAVRR